MTKTMMKTIKKTLENGVTFVAYEYKEDRYADFPVSLWKICKNNYYLHCGNYRRGMVPHFTEEEILKAPYKLESIYLDE